MTHPRNTKGLQQHAQARRQAALERAERAIQALIAQGRPINFSTVARAASVSTAWLYQQAPLKARIEQLWSGSALPALRTGQARASGDSKATIIATLGQRVEQLEKENRVLRKQLEVVYGELTKRRA